MKKVISIILSIALLLSAIGIISYAETLLPEPIVINTDGVEGKIEYVEVSSNKDSVLYADMKYGYFALQSKETGHIWYSVPVDVDSDEKTKGADKWNVRSQLVVSYIYDEDVMSAAGTTTTNSHQACVEKGDIKVSKVDDGVRVEYQFGDIKTIIPVIYKLTDKGFIAQIDLKGIKEPKDCYITDINLLPSFGAGGVDAEGQLLIPDGSGALINFNNGAETPAYLEKIYGDDLIVIPDLDSSVKETIRLPVFATITENNVLMGTVIKGDGSASIKATNGNSTRTYNSVSTVANLRSLEKLIMFKTSTRRDIGRLTKLPENADYEVRYNLLTNDKANYVGVAEKYREYLINEKGLKKQSVEPSLSLEFYGAIDTKAAFLGFEYSKLTALTKFSEAQTILEKLSKKIDAPIATRYLGYNNYGLLNDKTPTKATALSVLGGDKAFKKLQSSVKGKDVLYSDVDFIRMRRGSSGNTVKDSFNQKVEHTERLRSVFSTKLGLDPYKLLTPQFLDDYAAKYLKSVQSKGIQAVSMATLGNMIYSNSAQKASFHRYDFPKMAETILSQYKKAGIKLTVEGGNAYTLPYVDRVYNSPTLCSGYDIFDSEIPFYQIVLHGYVAMTSAPAAQAVEKKLNTLKTVESGIEFLYGGMYKQSSLVTGTRYDHLYATEYTLWLDEAVKNVNRYYPTLKQLKNGVIIDHYELAEDVMITVFDNGIKIITNYTDKAYSFDGVTVKANDYFVVKGGN